MIGFLEQVSAFVWGPPLLILIVGTGIYLTFRLGFVQILALPTALLNAFSRKKQDKLSDGDISHYQALTTQMAATIGTGNIVGVATAVIAGGPGAVFWMWVMAIFGMATKYAEAVLAVKYRVKGEDGQMSGGPMYYLERGLKLKWLAVAFAIFGSIAAFGIGNMVQTNAVSAAAENSFNIPTWVTGIILAIVTALVILGGIKSIGRVTAFFVPIMAVFYIIGGLIIMTLNFDIVPAAINLILTDAFTASAVGGGILGTVIRYGVARGIFSNEAGLGSAPIAAAAAKTDYPGRQGLVSMTQVFIDTIIVCSITGITIVMADLHQTGVAGGALTGESFGVFLGTPGVLIVSITTILFAYSTVIAWSYYGEKCLNYLFKSPKAITIYRFVWVVAVFFGATTVIDIVWLFSDIFNALMAIPNLIGLLGLSGVVAYETKRFLKIAKEEKEQERAAKSKSA
ncbi:MULTISPECIES: alanine/glycine:cation symporter family protein [Oceanobacillus]|uniref:Sodium:alanine symporter family protein n=1 Tax=Oceanobacillus profundus TaxID=372463 RepID=A0A417YAC4_9BACI|nr:sodium:alanine symporter family protein [Oceanobacillus profundus]MBR3118026.1 sodium:alanine symporter family protein [Oceanobacillus sp.]MCM3400296.1 sodium:alanine symporter family protein [Oceanobacillus profundus]PAE27482.1 sodium:alanine symporter family protein [Paenibacillus sp. 7884-2]RHW29545.1 sodium:alanine symporter family protein [Oceanobacillus profundus]